MNREQFQTWGENFESLFPDSGKWIRGLPRETRTTWFDDIFSGYTLDEALAMNKKLLTAGIPNRFERDQLPRVFIKTLAEVRYEAQRQAETQERQQSGGSMSRVAKTDPVMAKMLEYVQAKMDQLIKDNPEKCQVVNGQTYAPAELVTGLIEEASGRFDTEPDDETKLPRFKCPKCEDTGLAAHAKLKNTVGHCDCEKGRDVSGYKYRSGRLFGRAFRSSGVDNPFNDALDGL